MSQIDQKMLATCLQFGADVQSIAQSLGIPGNSSAARIQIVHACCDEAFAEILVGRVPGELRPVVRSLWDAWRSAAGQNHRADIQQLRRIIRAAAQMAAALRACTQPVSQ